mgnify:FL=1|jgi:hypothetical protein|tara:strand:- start:185 stop:349 length:165 start_codon:yes stop_codon:yes gene_type:complete
MKHNEQENKGNPRPSGNISYYNSFKEKEEMCREMAGYNDSLKEGYYNEKNKVEK